MLKEWSDAFLHLLAPIIILVFALLFAMLAGCGGPNTPPIRIVAFNLANGFSDAYRTPANRVAQARLLHRLSPDVVVLSEVDKGRARSGLSDVAAEVTSLLPAGGHLHYAAAELFPGDGSSGIALWVSPSYTVTSYEVQLPNGDDVYRLAIVAESHIAGTPRRIAATHLSPGPTRAPLRSQQLSSIVEFSPDVLAGDLNATYSELAPQLTGYFQATPDAIDSVWSRHNADGSLAPSEGTSDHPYLAVANFYP